MYLGTFERQYGVGTTWYTSDLRIYHAVLLTPNGIGLNSPGYLVGVENLHPESPDFMAAQDPSRHLGERHVLTHVVRYDPAEPVAGHVDRHPCVVYSLLDRVETDPRRRLYQDCLPGSDLASATSATASVAQGDAIGRFRTSLTQTLTAAPRDRPYTHILFMIMGWNIDQRDALENFNSLTGNLAAEAASRGISFRPLVVGVSWPALWRLGDWLAVSPGLVRLASFPSKRRDANDVGKWVLRDVIIAGVLPARAQASAELGVAAPPLVMIGHSFGARALVKALATQEAATAPFTTEDRLLLLQGAGELKDLYKDGGQGPLAEAFAKRSPQVTLTATRYDWAVASAIWGQYTGDIDTYDKVCRGKPGRAWSASQLPADVDTIGCGEIGPATTETYGFDLCTPTPEDPIRAQRPLAGKPVRYFDASHLINCQPAFSGGGAHGDIFRRETAAFLWDEILAPQP